MADIALFAVVDVESAVPFVRNQYPALRHWFRSVSSRLTVRTASALLFAQTGNLNSRMRSYLTHSDMRRKIVRIRTALYDVQL